MDEIRGQLRDAVFLALDELNGLRAADDQLVKSLDTHLTGERGSLDSLGVVNLIVILEQRLDEIFGKSVSLLDDERLDPTAGPFNTVGSLIEHLERLLWSVPADV